jgi:RHS repeat-associated protein
VELDGRTVSGGYRFGFNGNEKTDEISGEGNSYDFRARLLDTRIGRWLTIDPLYFVQESKSNYQSFANNGIFFKDKTGLKEYPYNDKSSKPVTIQPGTETPIVEDKNGIPLQCEQNAKVYNCHSFAWHKSNGDFHNSSRIPNSENTPKWDNTPEDDLKEQRAVQLHSDVRNKPGDKVIYFDDTNNDGKYDEGEPIYHSAIVSKTDKWGYTVEVTGKMGQNGISTNHPSAPGYYQTDDLTPSGKKLTHAYFSTEAKLFTLSDGVNNVTYDTNRARKEGDYWVVQDISSGKAYSVIINEKKQIEFYKKPK